MPNVVILGGAAMDGPRYIWWNFVSSRKERIEQAKADWKAARFAMVPRGFRVHPPARGVMTSRARGLTDAGLSDLRRGLHLV